MPFIIPSAAIGTGIALVAWGSKMILTGDDSADQFIAQVPGYLRDHIEKVEVSLQGVKIVLSSGAPDSAEADIRENVDVEGRENGLEVERES